MQTPAQVHGAKVQIIYELSKKNALFRAFLCLEDAASRYCLEVIGWDLSEWDSSSSPRSNEQRKLRIPD